MMKNVVHLYHSPLLSIPIFGSGLYLLQILLLKKGFLYTIYLSNKEQKHQKKIIKLIGVENIVFCHSHKFGRLLKKVSRQLIFDEPEIDIESLTKTELYNLMWTLVFCKAVTGKTKSALKNFIPSDFTEYNSLK